MDFVPPEDEPAPASLQTLRDYAAILNRLRGCRVIFVLTHDDVRVLADFIRAHGWNGVVEVERGESLVHLLAEIELEFLGVQVVIY